MRLDECFKKRLLRRERPDLEKCKRSIEVAAAKLDGAQRAFKHGLPDATVVLAYTAMFHAARAILFRDGVVEKPYLCGRVSEGKIREAWSTKWIPGQRSGLYQNRQT